jgi:rhodanese-related sulfurtransferase
MPSGRELMAAAQASMPTMPAQQVHDAVEAGQSLVILDVRELEEWDEGHIAQAIHLARGRIEGRIEETVPDKDTPIVCH